MLGVPAILQQGDGDCLAACAAMVLAFHQVDVRYARLLKILETQWFGTPFPNIERLNRFSMTVSIGKYGDFETIHNAIEAGQPLIVSVQAGEFPHYTERTDHAVVVVGLDEAFVYVNDPLFATPAMSIPRGDFALAWLEHDEKFAIVSR